MNSSKSSIDKKWFTDKLATNRRSLRELAKHMNLDAGAVSRTLSGHRKMKIDEAKSIASFLGTHVSEVLRHAGAANDAGETPRILLAATVNEQGQIKQIMEPMTLPSGVLARANAAITFHGNGDTKIIAAQVRASKGPLAMFDDAVLLFEYTDTVEPEAFGTLAICRNRKGEQILARIATARKTGEARLLCADNEVREFNLHTATPVLAIIP